MEEQFGYSYSQPRVSMGSLWYITCAADLCRKRLKNIGWKGNYVWRYHVFYDQVHGTRWCKAAFTLIQKQLVTLCTSTYWVHILVGNLTPYPLQGWGMCQDCSSLLVAVLINKGEDQLHVLSSAAAAARRKKSSPFLLVLTVEFR